MTDRLPAGPRKAGSADRVRTCLAEHGLADRVIAFAESTKTAQMAADAVACELGQIVKSLVAVGEGGRAAVALVAGDRRGDLEAIGAATGMTNVRMADADEVRATTGYAIGGVSPFDLPSGLPVLVDESLERFRLVYSAAGTPNSVIPLSLAELLVVSGGRMARISH
ncbi:MAG TPA: YbaK/EbsC family protein [Coriobacteriia bacterium]|jgi:Cys-tRNA(Pro) deacylase